MMFEVEQAGIVTLTPSPVIDRTYVVDSFERRRVHRAAAWREDLGGNGVNISGALQAHGLPSTALVPTLPSKLLRDAPSWVVPIPIPLSPRVNTIILEEETGHTTNVNQCPEQLPRGSWATIVASVETVFASTRPKWLVISGALPGDEATGKTIRLTSLIDLARSRGARIAIDVPGEWLLDVLDPAHPVDVVKPNIHELAHTAGKVLGTWGEIVDACQQLRAHGARTVLLSLGADGILTVGPDGLYRACSEAVTVRNTTGAGDAALAGYLASVSSEAGTQTATVQAASWGARAVSSPRSGMLRDEVGNSVLAFPAAIPELTALYPSGPDECMPLGTSHQISQLAG